MSQQNKKSNRIKTIYIVLVAYIVLFSAWWTQLLLSKNADSYNTRIELLEAKMQIRGNYNAATFTQSAPYEMLISDRDRQRNMIIGEASVYFVILLVGIWMVYRSFRQEILLARQQRNFLLSITHELKSPIASIRLILDTFVKRTLKPAQTQRLASNGIKEAERLHTLVNNILLAARLDNRFEMSLGEVNIIEFTKDVLGQLRSKYPDARFNMKVEGDIPVIQADMNALTSVELNLLENAVKYCPTDKEIDVLIKRVNGSVLLEVADHGIGVADEEKQKIFEKFYRVGSEDTRKTKGTGLGLYIVKSLVEAHKGTISIRDNEPNGAVFSVKLPIA